MIRDPERRKDGLIIFDLAPVRMPFNSVISVLLHAREQFLFRAFVEHRKGKKKRIILVPDGVTAAGLSLMLSPAYAPMVRRVVSLHDELLGRLGILVSSATRSDGPSFRDPPSPSSSRARFDV